MTRTRWSTPQSRRARSTKPCTSAGRQCGGSPRPRRSPTPFSSSLPIVLPSSPAQRSCRRRLERVRIRDATGMTASTLIDTTLVHEGVPGIAMEGEHLRLTLFPDAGAKILDLVHRQTGENLLWQNPRVPLRRTYPGASFDDVWCGGWDELFPTDAACTIGDNTFHDHGDLWYGPWEPVGEQDDGKTATVALRRYAVALPCLMEKWITVRRDRLDVCFRHRLTNLGRHPVRFVWNLHVAHAIGPDSRIVLPAEESRRSRASPVGSAERLCRCHGPPTKASTWAPCRPRKRASRSGSTPSAMWTAGARSSTHRAPSAFTSPSTRTCSAPRGSGASTAAGEATTCSSPALYERARRARCEYRRRHRGRARRGSGLETEVTATVTDNETPFESR